MHYQFKSLGIDFISYSEAIDTSLPSGQLLFNILGSLAEFERELIKERVKSGIAHYKSKNNGKWGRPKKNDWNKDLAIKLRKEGLSFKQIAEKVSVSVGKVHKYLKKQGIHKTPKKHAS